MTRCTAPSTGVPLHLGIVSGEAEELVELLGRVDRGAWPGRGHDFRGLLQELFPIAFGKSLRVVAPALALATSADPKSGEVSHLPGRLKATGPQVRRVMVGHFGSIDSVVNEEAAKGKEGHGDALRPWTDRFIGHRLFGGWASVRTLLGVSRRPPDNSVTQARLWPKMVIGFPYSHASDRTWSNAYASDRIWSNRQCQLKPSTSIPYSVPASRRASKRNCPEERSQCNK